MRYIIVPLIVGIMVVVGLIIGEVSFTMYRECQPTKSGAPYGVLDLIRPIV